MAFNVQYGVVHRLVDCDRRLVLGMTSCWLEVEEMELVARFRYSALGFRLGFSASMRNA